MLWIITIKTKKWIKWKPAEIVYQTYLTYVHFVCYEIPSKKRWVFQNLFAATNTMLIRVNIRCHIRYGLYCIDYKCSRTCINSSCGICMFSFNIFAHNCDEVWIRQKHQSCSIKCGPFLTFYFELARYSFHAINWTKWIGINYSLKLVTKRMNIFFYKFIISFDS